MTPDPKPERRCADCAFWKEPGRRRVLQPVCRLGMSRDPDALVCVSGAPRIREAYCVVRRLSEPPFYRARGTATDEGPPTYEDWDEGRVAWLGEDFATALGVARNCTLRARKRLSVPALPTPAASVPPGESCYVRARKNRPRPLTKGKT